MQALRVLALIRTCHHMSTHVKHMLASWQVRTHAGILIRSIVLLHIGTCQNMSVHISTCWHVHRFPCMPHIQIMYQRCWGCCYMSANDRTYRHMLAGVDTCQHIPGCRHLNKVKIIGLTRTGSVRICQHMSAHISTCRHVHMCRHLPASR